MEIWWRCQSRRVCMFYLKIFQDSNWQIVGLELHGCSDGSHCAYGANVCFHTLPISDLVQVYLISPYLFLRLSWNLFLNPLMNLVVLGWKENLILIKFITGVILKNTPIERSDMSLLKIRTEFSNNYNFC